MAVRIARAADAPFNPALTLWYDQPSAKWTDALPLGNGRLGAMVFGGVEHERLALNEDTLYSGEPPADLRTIDITKDFSHVQELLRVPLIGVIPESESVLHASNQGTPAIHLKGTDVADAYIDVVARFLGEERELRFVSYEKPGLIKRLFGGK